MKIIFLDIDGVLVTPASLYNIPNKKLIDVFCRTRVCRLNKIVQETNAKIVLSSSWRIGNTLDVMDTYLIHNGLQYTLYDKTPSFGQRSEEITHWIKNNQPIVSYVILEDDVTDTMEEEHSGHIVKTKWWPTKEVAKDYGLLSEHVSKAINILNTKN